MMYQRQIGVVTRQARAVAIVAVSLLVVACNEDANPATPASTSGGDSGADGRHGLEHGPRGRGSDLSSSRGAPGERERADSSWFGTHRAEGDGAGGNGTEGSAGSGGEGGSVDEVALPLVSLLCGDGVRDPVREECDDGPGNEADLCTAACQASDTLAVPGGSNVSRRILGEGRHPLAAGVHGFGVAFAELDAEPAVGLGVFDLAGDPRSRIVVSGSANPAWFANPVTAALPDGSFAVAWTDLALDGDELAIALRRVAPAQNSTMLPPVVGAPGDATLSGVRIANASRDFSQYDPDLLLIGERLIVAWSDDSDPATAPDIRYRSFHVNPNNAASPFIADSSEDQLLSAGVDFEGNVALAPFGEDWAAAWRAARLDGLETIEVSDAASGTRFSIGPHLGGAAEDHPALAELDATRLLVVYSVGTDPLQTGVADVGRLRAAVLDLDDPESVESFDFPPLDGNYADPALAQSQPNLVRAGDRLFVAWRSAARPGDTEGENLWLATLESGPPQSAVELRIPRWPLASFADQRFPALAAAPPFAGSPALPDPAPAGALLLAWEDYGQVYGTAEGQPDVVVQHGPLPLVRFAGQRRTDCSTADPCGPGEGDCDGDAECIPGLVCAEGAGPAFRRLPSVAVCVPPHCANGTRDGGETRVDCGGPDCGECLCGDGIASGFLGEQCDDGNADDTDACPTTCKNAVCGDRFTRAGVEACDTGGDSSSCDSDCTLPVCGDHHLNSAAGEVCDDGNSSDTDACPNTCQPARCGDGFVRAGVEACDGAGETASCDADCSLPVCGDGVVNTHAGEVCEPSTGPNCAPDCRSTSCTTGATCLAVEHIAGGSATDNNINPQLRLVNHTAQSVPLNQLKVRYWFTKRDGADAPWPQCTTANPALTTFCDFSELGCSSIVRSTGNVSPLVQNADAFLDLTFNTSQSIAAGQVVQVHTRIQRTDAANLAETNDYSHRTGASFAFNTKVTVYRNGLLIWGVEPAPPIVCGNQLVEACEACDNGTNDSASCDKDCTPAVCGDGYRNQAHAEACDPGPTSTETASCDSDCTLVQCPDGHVNPSAGEVCEPSIVPQCRTDCRGFTGVTGCTNGSVCLKAQYRATDSASDNAVRPQFKIVNNGFVNIPLAELRVRYYFTIDGAATLQPFCDFAAFPSGDSTNRCAQIQQTFTTINPARPSADRYLEFAFTGTTVLAPGASTGDIQLRFTKSTLANFNENNDYSHTGVTAYADSVRVAVFRNGTLIWGTPP